MLPKCENNYKENPNTRKRWQLTYVSVCPSFKCCEVKSRKNLFWLAVYDKRPSFFWVLSLIIDITGNPFWLTHGAITVPTSKWFSVACVWSQRLYWVLFCVTVLILSYTLRSGHENTGNYRRPKQLCLRSLTRCWLSKLSVVFFIYSTPAISKGGGGGTDTMRSIH